MKISIGWLKEFVNIKLSPEELADKLTMATAEVEKVKYLGKGLDQVVVGEILEIAKHPNADRLRVAKVKIGEGKILQIVCGAPNIEVGQKVPVALIGAVLPSFAKASSFTPTVAQAMAGEKASDDRSEGGPNKMEIKKSAIRGVESEGMLCADDELGLGEDHAGILILPVDSKLGQNVRDILGLDDAIIEIDNKSITHRPDLFNHLGIAREISAITGSRLKIKDSTAMAAATAGQARLKIPKNNVNQTLSVKVEDAESCPRYLAVVMRDIQVKESPAWMQNRLKAIGIRPINNLVDITNYILMEYGQPLHAFDADKLAAKDGPHIEIRLAKQGEKILALDGREYELNKETLVIADSRKPIAIAGIMGGEETGITKDTKNIIIESANFDPAGIRRSSRRLGLSSDSSLRFEKGLPPIMAEWGMLRAIQLVGELAGGQASTKITDIKGPKAEKSLKTAAIKLDTDKVRAVMGEEISDKKIKSILKRLDFEVDANFQVSVPLFRDDIHLEEDLIEEIARIYGYGQIEPKPMQGEIKPVKLSPEWRWTGEIKQALIGFGFDEIYNYSFYGENLIKKFSLEVKNHYEVINPLNPDQRFLRATLLPLLQQAAEKNSARLELVKIFEVGHAYLPEGETAMLGAALIDRRKERYDHQPEKSPLKGVIESLLEKISLAKEKISYQVSVQSPIFKEYRVKVLDVLWQGEKIGRVEVLDYNNLNKKLPLAECLELDLEKIIARAGQSKSYRSISVYPGVERDFAFVVNKEVKYGDLVEAIKDASPLIEKIEYLSAYESEELGQDKKSLAFRAVFQSPEKTLTSEEVDVVGQEIIKKVKDKFVAEIRR